MLGRGCVHWTLPAEKQLCQSPEVARTHAPAHGAGHGGGQSTVDEGRWDRRPAVQLANHIPR